MGTASGHSEALETALMKSIREKFGTVIDAICSTSSVQPGFMAALIANESGGDPEKTRFEKNVLLQLWEVEMGRKATFGSIGRADLRRGTTDPYRFLDNLATSWGLTQIMGYESIPFSVTVDKLQEPATSLRITSRMLADFAGRSQLDFAKDSIELFDCWNTGRPHATTADPEYIPNGLRRMTLYAQVSVPQLPG